jgi:hypothetical protein
MIFFYQFNIDLQLKSVILCKLYSFLIYFLPQFSAWCCAAVSLDRVVSVIFSIRGKHAAAAKRFNTPQKAFQVMMVIFFSLFLLNVQFFFYPNEYVFQQDQVQDVNIIYCSPENIPRYETFYAFWVYIDLSVNVLIPFAIMIASSVIIVVGVFKSTKNMSTQPKRKEKEKEKEKDKPNNAKGQPNLMIDDPAQPISRNNSRGDCKSQQASVRFNSSVNSRETFQREPLITQTSDSKSNQNFRSATHKQPSNANSKAKNVSTMLATNNIVFIR